MGIGHIDLDLLMRLRRAGHLEQPSSVIEMGAQQLANTFFDDRRLAELASLFDADKARIPALGKASSGTPKDLLAGAPLARGFWEWLGFRYAAIDIDGSPLSVPLDLNYDAVPKSARGVYDLVTNFGTTEHVANQLNAFKIIHDLANVGGIMIHHLPTQGMSNHGLVNYNMKFFWMLARSNQYEWLFLDYLDRGNFHGLRQDIIDFAAAYSEDFVERAAQITMSDALILVVFRKASDIEFVPPLDVKTGTKASNSTIARRYWTVFGEKPPVRSWLHRS